MSVNLESAARLAALKQGIEAKTGETYADLTAGVQALVDGFGQGGGAESDVVRVVASIMTINSTYTNIPETLKLHFEAPCELTFIPSYETLGKTVKIVGTFAENGDCSITTFNTSNSSNVVKEIDFGGRVIRFNPVQGFRGCRYLERINASLRFGSGTRWDRTFLVNVKLKEIRFVENHITVTGVTFVDSPLLSDDSLVSIANALTAAGDAALSMTLNATPKARCNEILGSVSQKTAEEGTSYDFFTADSAGTVTLTEFITTVKGWTIA